MIKFIYRSLFASKTKTQLQAQAFYAKYKESFLKTVAGAKSKELLVRDEDVQVLHGFGSVEHANAYLKTELFEKDVVPSLASCLTRLLRSGSTRWLKFDLARVGAGSVRAKFGPKGGVQKFALSKISDQDRFHSPQFLASLNFIPFGSR